MKPFIYPSWKENIIYIWFATGKIAFPFYSKLGQQLYNEWLERNFD